MSVGFGTCKGQQQYKNSSLTFFQCSSRPHRPLNYLASSWPLGTLLATPCHAGNSKPSQSIDALPAAKLPSHCSASSGHSVLFIRHPPSHLSLSRRLDTMLATKCLPDNSAPFQSLGVLLTAQLLPRYSAPSGLFGATPVSRCSLGNSAPSRSIDSSQYSLLDVLLLCAILMA